MVLLDLSAGGGGGGAILCRVGLKTCGAPLVAVCGRRACFDAVRA